MKTKIIYQIIAILILLSVTSNVCFSQFKADVDGSLDVSPVNGDLSYIYPISRNTIDGYPLSVNLNYVSNLMFVELYNYFKDDTTNGWGKFTRIHPAWIIGVNGFAVEVLSSKFRFTSTIGIGNETSRPAYYSEYDFTWLIEGYDFCNRMKNLSNPGDQDVIKILKDDGSVLELRNPTQRGTRGINDTSLYTGTYYENGINTKGYAVVTFDSTYWPSYFKEFANGQPDSISYIPRKLKYYNGDGLEYLFIEHPAPYGRRAFKHLYSYGGISQNYTTDSTKLLKFNVCPTIFYLEKINSSMGKITDFKRNYHYPKEDTIDVHRGRANLINFSGHTITYGDDEITIEALGRTIKLKANTKYSGGDDGNINNSYLCQCDLMYGSNLGLLYFENRINAPTTLQAESNTSYWDYWGINGVYMVTDIIDPENRKTELSYECYNRYTTGFDLPFRWVLKIQFINLFLKSEKEPTFILQKDFTNVRIIYIKSKNFVK